jgi:hypothetical protein
MTFGSSPHLLALLELSVGFVQVPVQLTATNQEIDLNVTSDTIR